MGEVFSVTEALVAWLASMGYCASSRVPVPEPDEFVTVERVGGGVEDRIDRPSVALQCWARTDERAEALALEVRAKVLFCQPPPGVHSMSVDTGPYPHYDENTRRPRYQIVLDLACQITI